MKKPMKWWQRLQVQFGVNWQLVPSSQMTWRQWAWDPSFGITRPHQQITTRWQLPEGSSYSVDTDSIDEGSDKKLYSRVFWVHGAMRVLGLDVGFGIFYRLHHEVPTP